MKKLSIFTLLVTLLAVGCTTPSASPLTAEPPLTPMPPPLDPVDGVRQFQKLAGLPDAQPTFSENTSMSNSPNGDFKVMVYKDTQGRVYSVNPSTFQVVEMDGRSLLPSYEALSAAWPEEELASRAEKLAIATTPDFETRRADLNYEAGSKDPNYFFDWRSKPDGSSMPPFIQVAFHRSGQLFAYYNTLLLD